MSILDFTAVTMSAMPWLSELKALPLHFKPPLIQDLKKVNNVFATVYSGSIYIFVINSPGLYLIRLWPWWVFMLTSILSVCILLILLLKTKKNVNEGKIFWPIIMHALLYWSIFCLLTLGCGLVKLYEKQIHLKGTAIHAKNGSAVPRVLVQLKDGSNKVIFQTQSNEKGKFQSLISKKVLSKIDNWVLEASANDFEIVKVTIYNEHMLLIQWNRIILFPIKKGS